MNQRFASPMRTGIQFLRDETGVTAIEYGLLAALIVVACIGGYTAMGGGITAVYNRWSSCVINALTNATLCPP